MAKQLGGPKTGLFSVVCHKNPLTNIAYSQNLTDQRK